MHLTSAQKLVIRNAIAADPVLAALPNNSDGSVEIAAALNLDASPDFWVYKTRLAREDVVGGTSGDGTTFTWAGAGYITRAQGERDAFSEIFALGSCNPSMPNVRAAFTDIFSGTGNAAANRTHIANVQRRKASRFEKLFATGTGSTASPATLVLEGPISYQEIDEARNS
jgi:hypothetical protein